MMILVGEKPNALAQARRFHFEAVLHHLQFSLDFISGYRFWKVTVKWAPQLPVSCLRINAHLHVVITERWLKPSIRVARDRGLFCKSASMNSCGVFMGRRTTALGILRRTLFARPRCRHFCQALDHAFDPLLPGLRRARLLESLHDYPPRGGCRAIEFRCCGRTRLQRAGDIWRK